MLHCDDIVKLTLRLDDHEKCIKQLQSWAEAHTKYDIEIDILELPLTQLRGDVNFPALNPSVDLVAICHESEVGFCYSGNFVFSLLHCT